MIADDASTPIDAVATTGIINAETSAGADTASHSTQGLRHARARGDTVAITVKLNYSLYETMKIYGLRKRTTNQEILVLALQRMLADFHV